jgi:hypothetical protein
LLEFVFVGLMFVCGNDNKKVEKKRKYQLVIMIKKGNERNARKKRGMN